MHSLRLSSGAKQAGKIGQRFAAALKAQAGNNVVEVVRHGMLKARQVFVT
jgi:hypothetical protein